jgi:hypothetical protein
MLFVKPKRMPILLVLLGFMAVTCGTLRTSAAHGGEKDKKLQDKTVKELKLLQGIWVSESAEPQSAQFTSHESAPYMVLKIDENLLQFEIRADGDAVPSPNEKVVVRYDMSKYSFAIDLTTNPKRLWTTKTEKQPDHFRWFSKCGYEVAGDRLRIVANIIEGGFPDSFTVAKNRHVYTFRRVTCDPRKTNGDRK